MPARTDAIARAISIIGHPFVTGTVLVVLGSGARAGLAFLLIAVVPMTVLMVLQVRRGRWEHVDASNRGERRSLYVIGLVIALVWAAYLAFSGGAVPRRAMVVMAMLLVCAAATRWIKLSLHLFFATMTATALLIGREPIGWLLAALVLPLIWSRLHLRRHSAAEVAVGCVLGIGTGILMHVV